MEIQYKRVILANLFIKNKQLFSPLFLKLNAKLKIPLLRRIGLVIAMISNIKCLNREILK